MIKKTTKVIFEDGENKRSEEMVGGIPLSKGEIIRVHQGETVVVYEVVEKIIDAFLEGDDQVVNITYIVKKK
ncbi:MAG: hypothetical protein Q8N84_03550 [bacterium]|nr:hypothetical protein [bacterium]